MYTLPLILVAVAMVAAGTVLASQRSRPDVAERRRIASNLGVSEATRTGMPRDMLALAKSAEVDDFADIEMMLVEAAADERVRTQARLEGVLRGLVGRHIALVAVDTANTTLRFADGTEVAMHSPALPELEDLRVAVTEGPAHLIDVANSPAMSLTFLTPAGMVTVGAGAVQLR